MKKVQINILVDAVGWEVSQTNSFLDRDDFPCRRKVKTILGYSSAAQPTILTGKMPSEHKQWAMFYHSPDESIFKGLGLSALEMFPSRIVHNRRIVRYLSRYVQKVRGIGNYFHLYEIPFNRLKEFNLSAIRDIYEPGGFNAVDSIFDLLVKTNVSYRVWKWSCPTAQAFSELKQAVCAGEENFFFLYTPTMDSLMHGIGPEDGDVGKKLEWFERKILEVKELAEKSFDDVEINVFSDHGMALTIGTQNIMQEIQSLDLIEGKDYLPFYDSTMARFWFFSDDARHEIVSFLSNQKYGTILDDEVLSDLGVFFNDRSYGDLIFLMDPGYLIVPSYMGHKPVKAMHGFSPDHKDSDAVFISNKQHDTAVAHIKDIFTVMAGFVGGF